VLPNRPDELRLLRLGDRDSGAATPSTTRTGLSHARKRPFEIEWTGTAPRIAAREKPEDPLQHPRNVAEHQSLPRIPLDTAALTRPGDQFKL
jgi:hypothetical protein